MQLTKFLNLGIQLTTIWLVLGLTEYLYSMHMINIMNAQS